MKKILSILLLVVVAFTSCYESPVGPEEPVFTPITLSESSIDVSGNGGDFAVTVTSNYYWTASTSDSWITVTTASGYAGESALGFRVDKNYDATERVGRILVVCEDYNLSAELLVKQGSAAVTLTITGAPEANLAAQGGELSLGYAIENPTLTGVLSVTTEAAWVKVGEITETNVLLTYEANTDAPGAPAREAVIKFAYEGAEDILVTLKQDSAEASFSVEFSEATSQYAIAMLTAVDQNMDWLCLLATTSDIVNGGYTTPKEYIDGLCAMAKAEGAPYLLLMSQIYQTGGGMGKGNSVDPIYFQLPYSAQPGDKLYMFVLGFNVDADMENWAYDNSTLATPAHIFEVPLLPMPVLNVQTENTVSSAAGPLVLDVTIENAVEGADLYVSTEAAWVTPTYADGKLTLAYEANTAAVSRKATITVVYGKKNVYGYGPDDWYVEPYCNPVDVVLIQEKDPNAVAVTLNIEVVGTQFNGIIVNVTPSDKNVTYALSQCAVEKDYETGAELEMDWLGIAENLLSYPGNATFHKGALTNHFIKMNPSNYQWYGYDYYVYAVPVEATSWGNVNTVWTVSQILGEVAYTKTTIDASKMPSLEWDVEKSGLVWNEINERYDLEVVEGSTVVLHFNVINPVEGAFVTLNGNSLYDSYNVVDGEPVIDNAAGTITLKIDKFDTAKNYHYVQPSFKYTNADGDTWGITTPGLRLTQVAAE